MSRCFPFPPPGYERQHKTEDLDLLKEAKRKEKKHKKEKKDKERKKDKEKEKDGDNEKQRDKKDRKGKHKDKKEKHRDNKKDKEKSSISEESTVAVKVEDKSGGKKLHPKVHSNDRSSSLNDGKCFALFQGQNGGKPSQSSLPPLVNDESQFIRELDRRIRDEGTGSQLPEKVAVLDRKHQEKVDNKNKKIERKLDHQGFGNDYGGNMISQNLTPLMKSKVGVIPKPVDEQSGRRLEDKEKYKETGGAKRGDKQKEDKESQAKEKDKEKEKKKVIKTENQKSNQNQSKDDGRNDFGGFTGNKTTDLLKDTNCTAANEGNSYIRKRKDMGTNGFLHESEIGPNKMQRPGPHQLIENGKKLEPSQTPFKSPHDKHAVPNSDSIDRLMMNGIIGAHKPSPSWPKPIAEASKIPLKDSHHMRKPLKVPKVEDLIAEASRRPPHPDSKYMVEVLTVPKMEMEEWSENDDQGWLFSKGSSRKPKVGPVGVKEYPPVWSETLHIESADVYALPYVIPY